MWISLQFCCTSSALKRNQLLYSLCNVAVGVCQRFAASVVIFKAHFMKVAEHVIPLAHGCDFFTRHLSNSCLISALLLRILKEKGDRCIDISIRVRKTPGNRGSIEPHTDKHLLLLSIHALDHILPLYKFAYFPDALLGQALSYSR